MTPGPFVQFAHCFFVVFFGGVIYGLLTVTKNTNTISVWGLRSPRFTPPPCTPPFTPLNFGQRYRTSIRFLSCWIYNVEKKKRRGGDFLFLLKICKEMDLETGVDDVNVDFTTGFFSTQLATFFFFFYCIPTMPLCLSLEVAVECPLLIVAPHRLACPHGCVRVCVCMCVC